MANEPSTRASRAAGAREARINGQEMNGGVAGGPNNAANPQGNLDLVQEIMRTFNETNILRRNRRLIFQ